MARCEISIEFDRSDRQYRGGESVSGSVHVVAKQDLTYDSITLIGAWHCHGYGLPVTRDVCGSLLDSAARLQAGERRSFPPVWEGCGRQQVEKCGAPHAGGVVRRLQRPGGLL